MPREDLRERLRDAGPEGYVYPDYGGYCFHRVVPTLLDALGGDVPADRTLPGDAVPDLSPAIDRVLLLFVDGFGDALWRRHADDPLLSAFEAAGRVTPLTSVYPSETAAAVTSHHTGLTTAEHGAIGWDQWVESVGQVVQTLPFSAGDRPADEVGATAEDLFVGDPLYPDAGVGSTVVQPASQTDSTYTRRAVAGAERRGYEGLDDCAATTVDAVESVDEPGFVSAYVPHVDAVAHASGADSTPFREEFGRVSAALRDLVDGLDGATAERTLVATTADHGIVDTDPETNVDLRDLTGVREHLRRRDGERIPPVGSGRNVHLFPEPGTTDDVRAAVEDAVDCLTFTREEALSQGLFGRGASERFRRRCGDLVVVPREKTVWHDPEKLRYVGMHGGLSPEEMLVPLATARASALRDRW